MGGDGAPIGQQQVSQYTPHTSTLTVLKRLQSTGHPDQMGKPDFQRFLAKLGFPPLTAPQLDALFASYDPQRTGAVSTAKLSNEIVTGLLKPTQFQRWAEDGRVEATLADLKKEGLGDAAARMEPALNRGYEPLLLFVE